MTTVPGLSTSTAGEAGELAAAAIAEAEALTSRQPRAAHVPVGPLTVFNGDLDAAADLCIAAVRARRGLRVATANMDFVARARRDEILRLDLERSSLVVADGAPVAWLARLAGGRQTRRVTGVDLVAAICRRASEASPVRVAFYGGAPAIAAQAAIELERRYPGVRVVTQISPPYRAMGRAEVDADVAALALASPDLVLIALGCPKQERFIAEHFGALPGATWIGVGGTFDFYAGRRRRAPKILQNVGAEWLTRLVQEPRRLWRRYLKDDLPSLLRVAPAVLRNRRLADAREVDELRRSLTGAA
ncbi:MAG: WecB/TagA/CpsF family glycosyltransferase [Dehalococcoidia bacterium]|nr:WecB/TagA/CpsF family glycosyltransferase [Dehalococcoidia bacterium]MCB9486045.1 WecB/TagA/CpsF family glycosyltransferase [Thermoflexaceae bacterium]